MRRRLRQLVVVAALAGALAMWRNRMMAANERESAISHGNDR